MTIPRILKGNISGDLVLIEGEEYHYASRVLRLRTGDEFLLRAEEREFLVKTENFSKDSLIGKVLEEVPLKKDPSVNLMLVLGIPEKDTFKDVLYMGTELGVKSFYPLYTSRVQGRLRRDMEHYRKIIEEVIRVSGRRTLPVIHTPIFLKDFLNQTPKHDLALVFYEESTIPLRKVFEGVKPSNILIFIGPEGGWEKEEIELIKEKGGKEVSLGEVVFKVRTAVLVALSLILHSYGDLG